jgi:hypothetical protein
VDATPAVELVWNRAAGAEACIDGGELARRVEATLGRPVRAAVAASSDPGVVRLGGQVAPLSSGWLAVVEVRGVGPALRREVALDVADCRQLDEDIVLVVALMADAAVPSAPRLTLPVRPVTASVAIGPDLAVAVGMLPGVSVGFGLASDVAFPPYWHFSAWAHAWPTSQALDEGAGGRLAAWTFGLGPCLGHVGAERASFFGCLGASGGVVYASGVGLAVAHSHALPYVQGELRGGLRVRLAGPALVRLEAGLGVPIARNTYEFTDGAGTAHDVFRTAPLVPFARLAVEFRAP